MTQDTETQKEFDKLMATQAVFAAVERLKTASNFLSASLCPDQTAARASPPQYTALQCALPKDPRP